MLVSCEITNWMSYKDTTLFSMVATRERQHGERVAHVPKFRSRLLPVAMLYGANASGKTNFLKALSFVKELLVESVLAQKRNESNPLKQLSVEPFFLDEQAAKQPTLWAFELLINENIYQYSLSLLRDEIIEETLFLQNSTSEYPIFRREKDSIVLGDDTTTYPFKFTGLALSVLFQSGSSFEGINGQPNTDSDENNKAQPNTNSEENNKAQPNTDVDKENYPQTSKETQASVKQHCFAVYDWFINSLTFVADDTRFGQIQPFIPNTGNLFTALQRVIGMLHMGVAELAFVPVTWESLNLPDDLQQRLVLTVNEGSAVRLLGSSFAQNIVVAKQAGELVAFELQTIHAKNVSRRFSEESDGFKRVVDLAAMLLLLGASPSRKVFVVDELDKSLHTTLVRELLEIYFAGCDHDSRTQLVFTTHDVLMLDQDILRRDEIWLTERNISGISSLRSLSDYKNIRYDKDIMTSYLVGRFGGVPRTSLPGMLDVHELSA